MKALADPFVRPLAPATHCLIAVLVLLWTPSLQAAVEVLLIGSSRHFDVQESGEHPDRLDPQRVAAELEDILNQGRASGGSTVVFEELFRTHRTPVALGSAGKQIETDFHCHSLAQYYFWPEGRAERLKRLREKPWDYAVIVGDPYLVRHMPGIHAEGVRLVAAALQAESSTKVVLLMPWLKDEQDLGPMEEAVHRIGQGLEIPVAPAGRTVHEAGAVGDDRASYYAAASIFSALSGRKAWGGSMQAAEALATVTRGPPDFARFFTRPTPFTMKLLDQSLITFHQTGTSSERGIKRGLIEAMKHCGLTPKEVRKSENGLIDFNYGRANSNFEADKRYQVDPSRFRRSYGFPMQEARGTAAVSMLYGIDKRYFGGRSYDDGTDLGVAYDMCRDGEVEKNVRAVPVRLLWAQLHELDPSLQPLRDRWHMSRLIDAAAGAYMVTSLTGRDPRGDEPGDPDSDAWKSWKAREIGYRTALRMALCFEPPGAED